MFEPDQLEANKRAEDNYTGFVFDFKTARVSIFPVLPSTALSLTSTTWLFCDHGMLLSLEYNFDTENSWRGWEFFP